MIVHSNDELRECDGVTGGRKIKIRHSADIIYEWPKGSGEDTLLHIIRHDHDPDSGLRRGGRVDGWTNNARRAVAVVLS